MALNDKQIRAALLKRLQTYKDSKIYEEFVLPSSKARADVVVVNGHFTGYEIKSDVDSLQRLPSQIKEYDTYLEKNYIVVGQKFAFKVHEYVPEHWGIIVVTEKNDSVSLEFRRPAKQNPHWSFNEFIFFLPANDLKYITKEIPRFQKRFSRTAIQGMIKQNIIAMINEESSKIEQKQITKITRSIFKGCDVRSLYKDGVLL
ncbi:sce7726 family protein [Streptococcus sanguinis]|uniref:sce7726 family protein n=1 Tax=Streptococcus sanguinis TaxID=1305 RepID=UPI0031B5712B